MKYFFILGFISNFAFSESVLLNENAHARLFEVCDHEQEHCQLELVYIVENLPSKIVGEKYSNRPTIKWYHNDVLEVSHICGSSCNVSTFINTLNGLSEQLDNTIEYDERTNLVAYAKDNRIEVKSLFKEEAPILVERDFSNAQSLVSSVQEFAFINSNTASISYLSGQESLLKNEIFVLKPQLSSSYPMMTLVKSVNSSSFLQDSRFSDFRYHPINLYDENEGTAWFEGEDGYGLNQYIEFIFFTPIDINSLAFINGYKKTEKLFFANSRVKELEININGIDKFIYDL